MRLDFASKKLHKQSHLTRIEAQYLYILGKKVIISKQDRMLSAKWIFTCKQFYCLCPDLQEQRTKHAVYESYCRPSSSVPQSVRDTFAKSLASVGNNFGPV